MKRLCLSLLCVLFSSPAAFAAGGFNLRVAPLVAIIGIIDLNLDYKINNNLTVGPSLSYMSLTLFDVTIKGSGFGVEGNYFFSGVYTDGFYSDFGISTLNVEASARSNSTGETAKATGNGLLYFVGGGYAWFWQSFNLNLGLNFAGTSMNKIEVKDSSGTTVESYNGRPTNAGLDFKIGFTF